jgi:hypothetical protein
MARTPKPKQSKRKRTYNLNLIKRNMTYEAHELAKRYGISRATVWQWKKAGLRPIENCRPYLFHGSDIAAFLGSRQNRRRATCQLHEMYCFKCRAPRPAWGGMADLRPKTASIGKLSALCGTCETPMHRNMSLKKLPEFEKALLIQTQGEPRISDCSVPCVKPHFIKDNQNG